MVANRHWCNKLWQAIRFANINLGPGFVPDPQGVSQPQGSLPFPCRWILARLNAAVTAVVDGFTSYAFGKVAEVREGETRRCFLLCIGFQIKGNCKAF